MPLKLLLDECILDKRLEQKLRAAGHDILSVVDVGLVRKPDHAVFEAAVLADRMIITSNCADFIELALSKLAKKKPHPGVLLVYKHNILAKEMSHDEIINAIANLEKIGTPLQNTCHKLNDYNY